MTTPTCATCPAFSEQRTKVKEAGWCDALPKVERKLSTHSCMLHPERAGAMQRGLSLAQAKVIALQAHEDMEQRFSDVVEQEMREQEPDHAD